MTRITYTTAAAVSFFALRTMAAVTTLACYKSLGDLDPTPLVFSFQSSGWCHDQCVPDGNSVMATTNGDTCYCGNTLPPASDKVDNSKCSSICTGYGQDKCGGDGYYTFYLTGEGNPPEGALAAASSSSSQSPTSTTASPSVITKEGQTIVVTAPASSESNTSSSGGGGSSKVPIAVGVVVGLLATGAIIGGIVLFLRRRKRHAIEEEHRRNAAINGFVTGAKSETSSTTDQRLDSSVFTARRQSVGSIADERDFSRRILQVRNPDRGSKASTFA